VSRVGSLTGWDLLAKLFIIVLGTAAASTALIACAYVLAKLGTAAASTAMIACAYVPHRFPHGGGVSREGREELRAGAVAQRRSLAHSRQPYYMPALATCQALPRATSPQACSQWASCWAPASARPCSRCGRDTRAGQTHTRSRMQAARQQQDLTLQGTRGPSAARETHAHFLPSDPTHIAVLMAAHCAAAQASSSQGFAIYGLAASVVRPYRAVPCRANLTHTPCRVP
jgi:hypothetical protein